jgi:hypothetical protein
VGRYPRDLLVDRAATVIIMIEVRRVFGSWLVDFAFDGTIVRAQVTFVDGDEILIGTRILRVYRLHVDFPAQTVTLK